jgi:hypothetical protein
MKRTIFVLLAVVALAATTGCLHRQARKGGCEAGGCSCTAASAVDPAQHCEKACEQPVADPGPQVGAVAYPYYNLRGPRDFLERNPQSIGP